MYQFKAKYSCDLEPNLIDQSRKLLRNAGESESPCGLDWGQAWIGQTLPQDLRDRVIAAVDSGMSRNAAASFGMALATSGPLGWSLADGGGANTRTQRRRFALPADRGRPEGDPGGHR